MVENTRASIALLILPLLGAPAPAAQRQAYQYPVKYVCGNRLSSRSWDAVFPGRYFSAINIRHPSVVAVYSAGLSTGVTTMDVEPIAARRVAACPDLTIGRFEPPVVTSSVTLVTLYVGSIGTGDAAQFDVRVEDPGRGSAPDRIQQTTVSSGLARAGEPPRD